MNKNIYKVYYFDYGNKMNPQSSIFTAAADVFAIEMLHSLLEDDDTEHSRYELFLYKIDPDTGGEEYLESIHTDNFGIL